MKLAFDGGAFQQGIAAGIYNVAVGLLNGMRRMNPEMSFVLVIDPRIGPARPELLATLDFVPEVLEAPVGPAYSRPAENATRDPHVAFEVDGRIVPAEVEGTIFRYKGKMPRRTFRIHSRVDQPSATGSMDTRHLGLGIREIRVESGHQRIALAFNDSRLNSGFHAPDEFLRWTSGSAILPRDLFDAAEADVLVEVDAPGSLEYHFRELSNEIVPKLIDNIQRAFEVCQLERRLEALGCSAYITNHFIPLAFRRLRNYAILYDLIPLKFPQFFMEDARRNFDYVTRCLRSAHHTFSISETSRRDLIEVVGIAPHRVSTMLIDIGPQFRLSSQQAVANVKRKYGLTDRPFIICVGTIEPRKNHHQLLLAFMASRARDTHTLVIVGKRGWGTQAFFSEVERSCTTADVRLLADVPTTDLPMLYGGAAFLAYPSLYEGFGLPVVEAMACGCPVLTSNTSSLAEIAEGAAVLVNPANLASITAGIDRLATNARLCEELRQKGLARRLRFSWASSAAIVMKVLFA